MIISLEEGRTFYLSLNNIFQGIMMLLLLVFQFHSFWRTCPTIWMNCPPPKVTYHIIQWFWRRNLKVVNEYLSLDFYLLLEEDLLNINYFKYESPISKDCFMLRLVEIGLVDLETIWKSVKNIQTKRRTNRWTDRWWPKTVSGDIWYASYH